MGHRFRFKTSLVPTGDACWEPAKPLRGPDDSPEDVAALIKRQLRQAAKDAMESSAVKDAFAGFERQNYDESTLESDAEINPEALTPPGNMEIASNLDVHLPHV